MIDVKQTVLNSISASLYTEYAVLKNPKGVFPEEEYLPLAPAHQYVDDIKAALMDMDGTTTSTEEICIHSLELGIRRTSALMTKQQWEGFDPKADYPNIIGNSTTKHVEYLVHKYGHLIKTDTAKEEFLKVLRWTLTYGHDDSRKKDITATAQILGFSQALEDICMSESAFVEKHKSVNIPTDFSSTVRLVIDVYYQNYHTYLSRLEKGESEAVKKEIFGENSTHTALINPMPGIEMFLPLLAGKLGAEVVNYGNDRLMDIFKVGENALPQLKAQLLSLAEKFEKTPSRLALVTSSIAYEAEIVLAEVLRVLTQRVDMTSLSAAKKAELKEFFSTRANVYNAFITASDSSEIRLKPFRDLYSIALMHMGIPTEDFDKVIGFEDSQSGTVAIRTAGVGCCVAVPFTQSAGHDFAAATHVAHGGLPEVMMNNIFLKK
ncbi:MAG: hypothetical protein PHD21_00840 [Flavobacteriales bacterium]|nr:hypothetical protein [Flavobacteriales bacterium]